MTKYEELQSEHQRLLKTVGEDKSVTHLSAVQEYIEKAKREAQFVSLPRDRTQLRAILRYWGSWVYDRTGVFPDTNLAPAKETLPPGLFAQLRARAGGWLWFAGAAVLLVLLVLIGAAALLFLSHPAATPKPANMAVEPTDTPAPSGVKPATRTPAAGSQPSGSGPALPTSGAASIPTRTALPPSTETPAPSGAELATSTPSVGEPLIPRPTSGVVVAVTATQAALPATSAPMMNTALPTPTLFLPPAGGIGSAGPGYIPATVKASGGQDCSTRTLTITTEGQNAPEGATIPPARVAVSPAESGEPVISKNLPLDQTGPLQIPLDEPSSDQTYLVRVNYPFPFQALIVNFPADCSRNQTTITFNLNSIPYGQLVRPTQNRAGPPLQIDWQLVNWGPVGDSGQWTATIRLEASGAGPNATYWNLLNKTPVSLPDRQMVILAEGCSPAYLLASVSSQGRSDTAKIYLSMVGENCYSR